MSEHYPMVESCRLILRSKMGSDRPPVRLPKDCLDAAKGNGAIPALYDFSIERQVLKKKEERESEIGLSQADSREELQRNVVARMQSVTNASEDVCVSLLETHSFDLKTAVETYLSN